MDRRPWGKWTITYYLCAVYSIMSRLSDGGEKGRPIELAPVVCLPLRGCTTTSLAICICTILGVMYCALTFCRVKELEFQLY